MQNMILQEAVLCCAVLCDKLEFICAESAVGAVGASREGLEESVNYSIQI